MSALCPGDSGTRLSIFVTLNTRPHRPQVGSAVEAIFFFLSAFLHRRIAYVTVFNSSATWAATFRLRGDKYMPVIFVFP